MFPRAGLLHLISSQSDHNLILLDTIANQDQNIRPFRFFNAWFRDNSCKEVIQQAWQTPSKDSPLFQLVQKSKVVKGYLKAWNGEVFGFMHSKIAQNIQTNLNSALPKNE